MKTLAVLVVFVVSLLGLGATLEARANSYVNITDGISEPVEMPGSLLSKSHSDKHRPDGGEDERGEEELFPAESSQAEALLRLDPTALDDVWRMRLAARR